MNKKILLRKEAAAETLGVCLQTVNQLIKNKGLPVVRIGGKVLINAQTLTEWLKQSQDQNVAETEAGGM